MSLLASSFFQALVFAAAGVAIAGLLFRWMRAAGSNRTIEQLRHELAARDTAAVELRRERDMMETFLRSVPDAIYFKDEQSRFLKCSTALARYFGASDPVELVGRTDFDYFSDDHARPAYEDEQRIIRTGEPLVGLVEKEVFPDGRVHWALTTKLPLRDSEGRIIGTCGISKNLTELKNAEEELRQRELLFRLIFEHAPVGVAWRRADLGNGYHFNPTLCRILGLPDAEAPDTVLLVELTHRDDLPAQREQQRRIESGEADSYTLEKRFVLKDGRLVWGRLSVAVVRNDTGHIIQEIAILEDISERKRTEQELADTYKSLLDASRVAGMAEVATGVLHNVGNVLNSINVSVNVLAESLQRSRVGNLARLSALLHEHASDLAVFLTGDPQGQRVLPYLDTLSDHLAGEQQRLTAEVNSLRRNTDHVKDIVSMQQEYAKVLGVLESLSPVDLLEDALRMNSAALSRHDVEVVREFSSPVPAVLVERPKVLQILINLIRNGKYALDEGRRTDKRLLLRIEYDERCARIIVADNGVGIPTENLERVFSHGFTTRKGGHGFGLHSSAVAARELGGSLTVRSEGIGQGATFVLELPRADAVSAAPPAPDVTRGAAVPTPA